jgi:hypothetical protein
VRLLQGTPSEKIGQGVGIHQEGDMALEVDVVAENVIQYLVAVVGNLD